MPSITTGKRSGMSTCRIAVRWRTSPMTWWSRRRHTRSEEHTSELQSRLHLVCRLLLEKKHKFNVVVIKRDPHGSLNTLTISTRCFRAQQARCVYLHPSTIESTEIPPLCDMKHCCPALL